MSKRLLIALVAIVVVAIPTVAFAEKFKTRITIHADNEQNRIFGVVRSPEIACEKRREVRLYGPDHHSSKRGNGEFRRYALTLTNRFGEYHFNGGFNGGFNAPKGPSNGFIYMPPGDYYTRAIRKDFPGDVCRGDDSQVATLQGKLP